MFAFKSIGTKLGVTFAGLFAATMLLISLTVYQVVTERAKLTVGEELTAAGAVFSRLFVDNARDKQMDIAIAGKDFGFLSALTSGDDPTIQSVLDGLASRVGVGAIAFIDVDGFVVGQSGAAIPMDTLLARVEASESDAITDNDLGILFDGEAVYLAGVTPVRAPHLIGWIVFGEVITKAHLSDVSALISKEFTGAIVPGEGNMLPRGQAIQDGQLITFAQTVPSLFDDQSSVLVLTYPLSKALAPYRVLAAILLILMATGGGAVSFISWWLARRLAKPIADLSAAANDVKAGREASVAVSSQDELGTLAGAFNDMSNEIAKREQDLRQQARTDKETDLPNRRAFEEALDSLPPAHAHVHVLAIRLERFAEIRNIIGFDVSAALITAVGENLRAVPGVAHIARLSGSILCARVDCEYGAALPTLTHDIRSALERTYTIEGIAVDVQFSMGISSGDPASSNVLVEAMSALEQARTQQTDQAVFDPQSAQTTADNLSLMGDLLQAIDKGHVFLVYQPKYDLREGRAIGVEALVRWKDPARGMVFPDQFIPLAEETGRVDALTRYVLNQALEAQQALYAAGHPFIMSINVSGRLIGNADFTEYALAAAQRAVGPLCFEITETAVIADPEKGMAVMQRFVDAGIEVSIDDYGSGLSSLAYLKKIPATELKIDKEFVLKIDESQRDALLVRSTVDLAHSLGMKVTAEGIETDTAAAILAGMGCDVGQGYGLGRPMELAPLFEHLAADMPALSQPETAAS
ncbi:MAG: EAL domain-containing protein [Pseudomonadota bacterium]